MSWDQIDETHDASQVIERPKFPALPDGKYSFVVTKFQRHTSKRNEPKYLMEAMTEHTFEGEAGYKTVTVTDYLDPKKDSAWYWKTNSFLRSIGGYGEFALEVEADGTYPQVIGSVFEAETKQQKTKTDDGTEYINARINKYVPYGA